MISETKQKTFSEFAIGTSGRQEADLLLIRAHLHFHHASE